MELNHLLLTKRSQNYNVVQETYSAMKEEEFPEINCPQSILSIPHQTSTKFYDTDDERDNIS